MEHLRNIELACARSWRALHAERLRALEAWAEPRGHPLRKSLHDAQRYAAIEDHDAARCDAVLAALRGTMQVPTLRLNAFDRARPDRLPAWSSAARALPSGVRARWEAPAHELAAEGERDQPLPTRSLARRPDGRRRRSDRHGDGHADPTGDSGGESIGSWSCWSRRGSNRLKPSPRRSARPRDSWESRTPWPDCGRAARRSGAARGESLGDPEHPSDRGRSSRGRYREPATSSDRGVSARRAGALIEEAGAGSGHDRRRRHARSGSAIARAPAAKLPPPMISISKIAKHYEDRTLFEDVSMQFNRGRRWDRRCQRLREVDAAQDPDGGGERQ